MSSVTELQRQVALARTEIRNLRNQMSALKQEHLKHIGQVKSMLERCSTNGFNNSAPTLSPTQTSSSMTPPTECVTYRPIGHLETGFHTKRAVPRQPSVSGECRGTLVLGTEVYSNPEHALEGLMEFSHMWIIFHMHATESNGSVPAKVCPPRLRGERRGVLATRSPHRPCPVGLSLVRILSVEGNRIQFSGVDMLSGSVVLDIKPYIPQYDYPVALRRPPAEGNSEAPAIAALTLADDSGRLSPRLTRPIGIETESAGQLSRSSDSDEGLVSPDARGGLPATPATPATPASPSPVSPSGAELLDSFGPRSPEIRRPPTERGAPDGQERFTPPQSAHVTHDGIRVPSWITNPPSQPLEVRFSDDALARLSALIGDRADTFKTNLECLLTEDPRSQYVRTRYPDHEYSCVLEDLSISCLFDNAALTCTVMAVRCADEMQQT